MLFKKFVHRSPLIAAQVVSCSVNYSDVVDIFCYVQTRNILQFEESMPVAVNHVKLRNTLSVSELYIGRNSIFIFTVVIVFMNQSGNAYSNNNPSAIDISKVINSNAQFSLHRFFNPAVGGFLADRGHRPFLKFESNDRLSPSVVWQVRHIAQKVYYIRNNATKRYICFTGKGQPKLYKYPHRHRCGMRIMKVRVKSDKRKASHVGFQLDRNGWHLAFCRNGRPFVHRRPLSRKCSEDNLERKSWIFGLCVASLPPLCFRCFRNGIYVGGCDTNCQNAYNCKPKIPKLNISPLMSNFRPRNRN